MSERRRCSAHSWAKARREATRCSGEQRSVNAARVVSCLYRWSRKMNGNWLNFTRVCNGSRARGRNKTRNRESRVAESRLLSSPGEFDPTRRVRLSNYASSTVPRFICVIPSDLSIISLASDALRPCSETGRSFGKKTLSAFEDRSRPVSDCGKFAAVAEPRSLGS